MSKLFSPLDLREITFKNRIFLSPMCQYSAVDGIPNQWHLVHLGSRAVGGVAMVIAEASGVSPIGRISPADTGIWNEEQVDAWRPIARFIKEQKAVPAIQLAHAGRKASTDVPWRRGGKGLSPDEGGWEVIAPSAVPFAPGYPMPRAMLPRDIDEVTRQFADAAFRAREAGFEVVEVHMAHGYLLHEFLSPLSNQRTDDFGGSLENRMRFPLAVASVVREVWPAQWPVLVRISATDWADGGWDLAQSIELCQRLREVGVDLIDCSSGGAVPGAKIEIGPGYQVPFASEIRQHAGIATGAVGLITKALQAEQILAEGHADAVLLARPMLRNPYWPLHAAETLDVDVEWPIQYTRGKGHK